jgi:tetratricopeptide (TPR) repeat protein
MVLLFPMLGTVPAAEAPAAGQAASGGPAFAMTNDAEYRRRFDLAWSRRPDGSQRPELWYRWLFAVASAACELRYDPLAEAATREAIARWPHSDRAWSDLADFLINQGRFQDSLDAVDRAVQERGHESPSLTGNRAICLWSLGRHDDALALLAGFERPDGGGSDVNRWLAYTAYFHAVADRDDAAARTALTELWGRPRASHLRRYIRRGKEFDRYRQEPWFVALVGATATGTPPAEAYAPESPVAQLDALAASIPHDASAESRNQRLARIYTALAANRWDEAVDLAQRGREADPYCAEFHATLALALSARGDHGAAMEALREASRQDVDFTSGCVNDRALLDAFNTTVKEVLDVSARDAALRPRGASVFTVYSAVALGLGLTDLSLAGANAALNWNPELPEAYNYRAVTEQIQHRLDAADDDLREALRLAPTYADASFNRALVRCDQGRFDEGLASLAQAREWREDAALSDCAEALIRARSGQIDAGCAIIDRLSSQKPPPHTFAHVVFRIGKTCDAQGRFADAERMMRLTLVYEPSWSSCWTFIVSAAAHRQQPEAARDAAQHALDEGPDDAGDALIARAVTLWLSGDHEQAQSQAAAAGAHEPAAASSRWQYHVWFARWQALRADRTALKDELRQVFELDQEGDAMALVINEPWLADYREQGWFRELVRGFQPEASDLH